MQVWIQLFYNGEEKTDAQPFRIQKPQGVEDDEWDIDALKDAVKLELGDDIGSTPFMKVYPAGTSMTRNGPDKDPLEADKKLSDVLVPTASGNPLMVVVVRAQMDLLADAKPPKKRAKSATSTIDCTTLYCPADVVPPNVSIPAFVCRDSMMEEVKCEVINGLDATDSPDAFDRQADETLSRVAPMAVVRCSRGGKTRFLCEVAKMMRGYNNTLKINVACLYVSLNDYSSIRHWEHKDPLQALLRRIAFEATVMKQDEANAPEEKSTNELFSSFIKDEPIWEEESFLDWIGSTPCVLLIDGLNNFTCMRDAASSEASAFCEFIKLHFISKKNRFFVFSSHVMGTLPFFSELMDASQGSARAVELQELPLVPSLEKAITLSKSLDSTREAVYYGLVPGMIYEAPQKGKNIYGKRMTAVANFIERTDDYDAALRTILRSLITGEWKFLPKDLLILLDSVPHENGLVQKIRWIPFHLRYVLDQMGQVSFGHARLADKLADLCNILKESKAESGEGWESLFVLFLVAYCITGTSDGVFVPEEWFEQSHSEPPKVFLNGPYSATDYDGRTISVCQTWDQLKPGVRHGQTPQLSIYYPTHNSFEVYDVIVVYSDRGEPQSVFGYQLKEGKAARRHEAHSSISRSFLIQGTPPKHTINKDKKGWSVPNKAAIDSFFSFFGESGKHWTPEAWKVFSAATVASNG